jgi:hypothetical protein
MAERRTNPLALVLLGVAVACSVISLVLLFVRPQDRGSLSVVALICVVLAASLIRRGARGKA